jgi:fucose permease
VGWGGLVGALALWLFSRSEEASLSLVILFVAGFSITTVVASTNAYIQVLVEDQMRGRVMSLFSMIFVGMAPMGSLSSGVIAEWWGIQSSVLLFSLLGGVGSLLFIYQHYYSDP